MQIKYLLLISVLLFTGCSKRVEDVRLEPKFMKGQRVRFKVPHFYTLVCKGEGAISKWETNGVSGKESIWYEIIMDDRNGPCEYSMVIREDKIELVL